MSSDFKHNRRSCRLHEWDYRTPGSYFITIKTGDGTHCFNNPRLKAIAEKYWKTIPRRHDHVELGVYEIMPDHIHGIITIVRYPDPDGKKQIPARRNRRGIMLQSNRQMLHNAPTGGAGNDHLNHHKIDPHKPEKPIKISDYRVPGSIGSIIQGFKTVTQRVIRYNDKYHAFEWQRDYHDHIIRDAGEYDRIAAYIRNNRLEWELKHGAMTPPS
ncbi:MAG: hypothetical protein A2487_02655 [Candidatus Raymondbacteria bacterium RifOxyC12_full_50_8]|uniref:Transposase IS200-like domain-containing protein n=1 Tax=Candidatus Raymondbacteria bacterium RIFOXYD12_FULL_49_13 TaxID=1817890 RepID=A0A1F7F9W8_UNCRA|nr:MAG: hypothetical protein A2350_06735 [Candidatus Raymondbacteria bacterium RifOxyB12_full_50_8]OGJ93229.1 MAG: hypothetical protein A2248_17825 [Candidatus Raymondbacteria bacterium RIFOXYA2_FULL_49_16]OGJ94751.1 MAG: hypothetical protein A2487_02655 [Candidatus Raymondbacteria bacterium RifOxyC12_full_50_8]OGK03312.1 MAG: hypothetical protein A2519_15170 [Candidatus Raymondbacteria bacterium RIFOXYD12_FULL_49_13]OGP44951.1 MAG: hypothetical protein A2324_19750 [Candidatus Raymondbacteria b